jgi:hypothetical protein
MALFFPGRAKKILNTHPTLLPHQVCFPMANKTVARRRNGKKPRRAGGKTPFLILFFAELTVPGPHGCFPGRLVRTITRAARNGWAGGPKVVGGNDLCYFQTVFAGGTDARWALPRHERRACLLIAQKPLFSDSHLFISTIAGKAEDRQYSRAGGTGPHFRGPLGPFIVFPRQKSNRQTPGEALYGRARILGGPWVRGGTAPQRSGGRRPGGPGTRFLSRHYSSGPPGQNKTSPLISEELCAWGLAGSTTRGAARPAPPHSWVPAPFWEGPRGAGWD